MDLQMNTKLPLHGDEGMGGSLSTGHNLLAHLYENCFYCYQLSTTYTLQSWEVAPVESDNLEDTLLTVHGCPVTYTRSLSTLLFTQS